MHYYHYSEPPKDILHDMPQTYFSDCLRMSAKYNYEVQVVTEIVRLVHISLLQV